MKNFLGINWKIRFKSKVFWATIIPLILLLIQQVADLFGFTFVFDELNAKLQAILSTVFLVLAGLGIVNENTTPGVTDDTQTMNKDDL